MRSTHAQDAGALSGLDVVPLEGSGLAPTQTLLWRASRGSIADSVRNAIALARDRGFATLAMPVIGAGSGGFAEAEALAVIDETLRAAEAGPDVTVVRSTSRLGWSSC